MILNTMFVEQFQRYCRYVFVFLLTDSWNQKYQDFMFVQDLELETNLLSCCETEQKSLDDEKVSFDRLVRQSRSPAADEPIRIRTRLRCVVGRLCKPSLVPAAKPCSKTQSRKGYETVVKVMKQS